MSDPESRPTPPELTAMRFEAEGPVGTLTLMRPDDMNAMDPAMIGELAAIAPWLADRAPIRALIVTGEGRAFSAGGDVNWFRRDASGKFLWPGFGDNLRVLRWIIDRCEGKVGAVETPIGFLPKPGDIDVKGLDVSSATLDQLLAVDAEQWRKEMESIGEYFAEFGERLPAELKAEHQKVLTALG